MDGSLKYIGGARIGWVSATWPLAILTVTRDKLILNATLIGKYSFSPNQIISLRKYIMIPFLGWGIKICHNISDYPKNIVFCCLGNPDSLIRKINQVGFIPAPYTEITSDHKGIPVRWQALIVICIIWNSLILLDTYKTKTFSPNGLGIYSFLAIFLLFLGSIGVWRSTILQRFLMKEGRNLGEIKPWLHLVVLVTGFMLIFLIPRLFLK